MLFPHARGLDILLKAGGVSFALRKLKQAGRKHPNQTDRKMAKFVVDRISTQGKGTARTMADYSVQWNNISMWMRVVKASGADNR